MGKICIAMIAAGAVAAFLGYENGSQNTMFLGALTALAGAAGIDRILRPF